MANMSDRKDSSAGVAYEGMKDGWLEGWRMDG